VVAAPAAVMATAALASTLDSSAALLPSALKSEAGEHSAAPPPRPARTHPRRRRWARHTAVWPSVAVGGSARRLLPALDCTMTFAQATPPMKPPS